MVPLLLAAWLAAGQTGLGLGGRAQRAVDAYLVSLEALERRAPGVTVERVFLDARELRILVDPPDDQSGLEQLSPSQYDALAKLLRGILLARDDVVFAEIDTSFFLELAQEYGAAADQAFFAEYQHTYSGGALWPSYVQPQTDLSGCVDFSSGELLARYAGWLQFARRFPGQYAAARKELVSELEADLIETTCACGDADSVLKEFREFERRFPESSIVPQVRRRIDAIEQQRSDIRFNCTPK